MKLSSTEANNSFRYSWLLKRIFPFIKPYLFRIFIGIIIALPLGLLDGVTAYVLKPYMDFVISGKTFEYTLLGYNIVINSFFSSTQSAYIDSNCSFVRISVSCKISSQYRLSAHSFNAICCLAIKSGLLIAYCASAILAPMLVPDRNSCFDITYSPFVFVR